MYLCVHTCMYLSKIFFDRKMKIQNCTHTSKIKFIYIKFIK